MGILRAARTRRDATEARTQGFDAALGVGARRPVEAAADDLGTLCPTCGVEGGIDLVDVAVGLAFLTCPACAEEWTTRRLRRPQRAARS